MFLFNSTSAVERFDLQTYKVISSKNVAVFLIDFPDIPQNIKAQFPTVAEAQDYFVDGLVKDYFTSISYNKLQFSGKVFGYYTMPDSLTKERQNNEFIIETTENYDLKIDCYEAEDFDTVVFIIFHHEYEQGGLSAAGFANYTINGIRYENRNVVYLGAYYPQEDSVVDTYNRPAEYNIRTSGSDQQKYHHPCGLKYNQAIFIHEFIHQINGFRNIPHSNSCTNNGKYDFEKPDAEQPQSFSDLEYGNGFDIMGGGRLTLSLNAGYRYLCGWLDEENSYHFEQPGAYPATIFPLNRKDNKIAVEIRMKHAEKIEKNYPGYFIELREPDRWDASLANPDLFCNTRGLLVYKTDGFKTMLLDMSPSKNFVDSNNKHFVDYRNMSLKESMEYENSEIKIWNVKENNDGSFSMEIKIKNNNIFNSGR